MKPWIAIFAGAGFLLAQGSDAERSFADIFAAVLAGENPDGGIWEGPGRYLEAAARRAKLSKEDAQRALKGEIDKYRVLIVPGFMSECAAHAVSWPRCNRTTIPTSATSPSFTSPR